ncbi:hypothetical protein BAE36_02165 [Rhizobium leguminosarum bv. trifolii]|nr:hypothetical protein BAE36_02165 [Rhizobium leguminosarum bv. trifolii]
MAGQVAFLFMVRGMEPEASSFLRIFAGCADWDSTLVTLLIASGQTPDKPQHLSEPASLRSDDIEFGLQRLSDLDVLTPRPAATGQCRNHRKRRPKRP